MAADAEIANNWIHPSNVETLFETVSRWVSYSFDASDWAAIDHGLSDTDVDENRWFTYLLMGTPQVDVHVARNVGAAPVTVRVSSNAAIAAELRLRINTLVELLNCYEIARR